MPVRKSYKWKIGRLEYCLPAGRKGMLEKTMDLPFIHYSIIPKSIYNYTPFDGLGGDFV